MTRRASIGRWLLALLCLALLAGTLAPPAAAQDDDPPDAGPRPGAIGAPVAPLDQKRLYDMADLLDNGQEASVESDATRLTRHGIPVVIILQRAAMSPDQAAAFASDVRRDWSVESAPDADDGLVMLITVADTNRGQDVVTTMSWGVNALPHFGVTQARSDEIQRAWLDRYTDQGYPFEGIVFTLRRLIYHSIYDPAPQAALTGTRAALGGTVSLLGPALAIGALALAGWSGSRRRRDDLADLALAWGVPALAVAIFALAVVGRSGWGVVGALALLGVAAFDWVARDPRRTPRQVAP